MKLLLGLTSLILSTGLFASTVDTATFIYDGSRDSVELVLNAEKTHTEYRTEERPSTCYRQEFMGYRTVCSGGYGGGGHPRRGGGWRGGARSCWSQPVYRRVAYSCMQSVTISYEVKDYDVDARVIVDVTNLSSATTPGETFKVTLKGDKLSFEAIGSKKFFIVKKKDTTRSSMNGSVKFMDALLVVELIESAPVLKALKITDNSFQDENLRFNIGPTKNLESLGFSLKVTKVKFLANDPVLFDRKLADSELQINSLGNLSEINVNLKNLNFEMPQGKLKFTTEVFAKFSGELMNTSDFRELSVSKTLIYKNR